MIDSGMETKASGRPPIRGMPAKRERKEEKKQQPHLCKCIQSGQFLSLSLGREGVCM